MKKLVLAIAATVTLGAPAAAMAKDDSSGPQLEHCDETLGTLAVVEDQDGDWYRYLTTDLRLGSLAPMLRMMVQQSNCFAVVERGRAMRNMRQERSLADEGELRSGSKMGKGQMVAADYTLNPSINFSQNDAGGVGASVGGLLSRFGGRLGGAVGSVSGGLKFKRAETIVTMIDNRSGVQIASAQGEARKTDFGLSGWGWGGSGGASAGGYTNTPEGKVLAAAFMDAYNNMVRQIRNYKPQQVKGGLGKGGRLKVGD